MLLKSNDKMPNPMTCQLVLDGTKLHLRYLTGLTIVQCPEEFVKKVSNLYYID